MISFRLLSPDASPGLPPQKFEVLLERLEQIVADMENNELPLEKLLASYEEGMKLVKTCGDRLSDAEQKVEILSKAVTATAAPLAGDTELTAPPTPGDPEEDIRLF